MLADIRFAVVNTMYAVLALAGYKKKIELPSELKEKEEKRNNEIINYLDNMTSCLSTTQI